MRHGLVQFIVLQLDVLVEGPLRPIGLLASLHTTSIVSLYLTRSTPESFLSVFLITAPILDLLRLFLNHLGSLLQFC